MDKQTFYVTEYLSDNMGETPEGFLACYNVPIARMGEYIYKNVEVPKLKGGHDGLIRIQRDEDEVFNEVTMMSFEGKPVTINHPHDFVTADNWKQLAHGYAKNVRRGDGELSDLVIADLLITTSDAISLIKAGLREVSCGYDAQYEQIKPGYGRQTDIIGNHIALVVKGRAGNRCAIMDQDCTCCANCTCGKKTNDGKEDKSVMKEKSTKVRNVLSALFPSLKPTLDAMKDEDLVMGEEEVPKEANAAELAQQKAAEAKNAAIEAVEAAKQAAEAAATAMKPQEAAVETPELKAGDDDVPTGETDPIAGMNAKLDTIIDLMTQMMQALTGEEEPPEGDPLEEKPLEEEPPTEEEPLEEEKGLEKDEDEDEDDDKLAEEIAGKTQDAIWQNVISRAEIIAPGIVAAKPKAATMVKTIESVKRKALTKALTKDHAGLIKPLLGGKKVEALTLDALDAVFIASSEMIAKTNTAKVQKTSMQMKDFSSHTELAEMNKKNKEFWNKK